MEKSLNIIVKGLVQGVGFRPFVFRIATRDNLSGWVRNTNENVMIQVTGDQKNLDTFLYSLKVERPAAAIIEEISTEEIKTTSSRDFRILNSRNVSDEVTEISPDIAVCEECLLDMDNKGIHKDYAFVNCTNCGPRFTITEDLPYDRAKTTMKSFMMCPACQNEYNTVTNRRFHAQPTACNICGPQYEIYSGGLMISNKTNIIIEKVSKCIDEGGVVLLKGLGGMHLACDAFDETAVRKLREVKNRDGKPFALMFFNIEKLRLYAETDSLEEKVLSSWRRPIVLLEKKKIHCGPVVLANNLNSGLNLLGVMLPYMPFHYLLFRHLKTSALVLTSGNFSSEPILKDNQPALDQFANLVDIIVLHNRSIYNRTDDSVVRIIGGKERIFRRSRGYVPAPVRTSFNSEGIVAFGAELTNCFCAGKGNKAFMSQHIGDLQTIETTQFYESTIKQFLKLFRIKPSLLAVDKHPGYISTRTGMKWGNLPVVHVQHHHAHIASCMAEYGLDEKVIGVAFDGTGYGTDGNIWGSEFLICDLNDFSRVTHFEYMHLPGGDSAAEEPWRLAISSLYKVYGKSMTELDLPFYKKLNHENTALITRMIDKNINCPLTSGAGRLFDTVASLLDVVQVATFQAEGPMRLESLIRHDCTGYYEYSNAETICFDKTIRGIVEDIRAGTDKETIATKFHNTIILIIFECVNTIRSNEGINKVVLSGGVFQNKYLLEGTTELLEKNKFEVWSHSIVPTNDGGIALGQLAVASKRRELQCV